MGAPLSSRAETCVGATVSVVIPTRGRPERIVEAVYSALRQTYSELEVVVVVDGVDDDTHNALQTIDDPRLRVIVLPESRGAGGARNAGVAEAAGDYIAFLDDDDTWRPEKIAIQIRALSRMPNPRSAVVSCAARWRLSEGERVWPTRAISQGERVADYLFVRAHAGEGMLATPTLLLASELARRCPMPRHLRTHEEWDWLLDLEKAGAAFHVVPETLVDVDARADRASVTTGAGWEPSAAWALTRAADLGPRAFSAFVLNEAARSLVLSGGGSRAYAALAAMALTGRPRPRDVFRFVGRPIVLARRARLAKAR